MKATRRRAAQSGDVEFTEKTPLGKPHPFYVPAPFGLLNFLHRTLLRPLWLPLLRWWVTPRPIVCIRPRQGKSPHRPRAAQLRG